MTIPEHVQGALGEVLALGTTSKHKVQAAKAALARAGAPFEVRAVKTTSGVPEQPVGVSQTQRGALNRARGALHGVPDARYGLGVESGLVKVGNEYVDLAVVALLPRDGEPVYSTSVGVQFPKDAVRASLRGQQSKTAGDFIAEAAARKGETVDGTDPHAYLTKGRLQRNRMLEDAIFANLVSRRVSWTR